MNKIVTLIILCAFTGIVMAQKPIGNPGSQQPRLAERKFQILVENEKNVKTVQDTNERLLALQKKSHDENQRSLLLASLLFEGLTSAFKQKTINATSNLVSLGINYATEAMKSKRKKWYQRAQQQCFYHKTLSTNRQINNFYALPSTKGAMDPENLKFEGFGCKNYIQVMDGSNEGVGVFYIFCKMRRDSIGLQHIINHGKFMVEIDSLIVNPKFCNLPNDSTGSVNSRFSFEKRDNLSLEFNVNIYSSWMNQAIMYTENKLLGRFTVSVDVDKNKLNKDGMFVYDKNNPDYKDLVNVYGDCYIVPRSYTGTIDGVSHQPTWGTGEYSIEMEISEQCSIVDSHYQIREAGNGETVAFADATPGKKRWDKAKWKVEWNAMNSRRKGDSFFKNAWNCIVSAYKGSGWVATFTDPITTALYSWESRELGDWIDDIQDKIFDEKKK